MSWLSDIAGGGAQQAGQQQVAGIANGLNAASPYLFDNINTIQNLSGAALQPYQQNYGTAQQGVGALGNLLGLNGAQGSMNAQTALATTPGYQFTKGQGEGAINATAAANGTTGSGNALTALSNYDSGLASNTYQSAVSNLTPYLSLLNSSAGGEANVLGNQQTALTGNNNLLAQLIQGSFTSAGNAQAGATLKQGQGEAGLLSGALSLGGDLLGGLGGLGGIGASLGGGLSGLFGGGSSIMSGIDGAYGGGGLDSLFT